MDDTTQPIQWYRVVLEIGSVLRRNEAISAAVEALRSAGFGAEADGDQFDLLCVKCGQPITGHDDLIDDEQGYRHRQCPERTREEG
jgi:hypothetical protein